MAPPSPRRPAPCRRLGALALALLAALAAAPRGAAQSLLITQMVEGKGGAAKLLTVSNVDPGLPADLGDFAICRAAASEGAKAGQWEPLVAPLGYGPLAPSESITLAWKGLAAQACPKQGRLCVHVEGARANANPFTGNDALGLFQRKGRGAAPRAAAYCQEDSATQRDAIGGGPGTHGPWDAAGMRGATQDHTLLRKPSAAAGAYAWDSAEAYWARAAGDTTADSQWRLLPAGVVACPGCGCSFVLEGGNETCPEPGAACPASAPGSQSCQTLEDCSSACCGSRDDRTDKKRLKIVTFNTEWLFDGAGRETSPSPYSRGKHRDAAAAAAAADAHLADLCGVLEGLDPDIAVLQEVEDCGRVKALASCLNAAAGGTAAAAAARPTAAYLVQGTDSATGQDVALLSKLDPAEPLGRAGGAVMTPLDGSNCSPDRGLREDKTGVSKNLYALFHDLGGNLTKLAVVGAHLLAYPTAPDRCAKREGQAEVLRGLVASLMDQGYEVAVMGDLNDFDGAVPDAAGSKPNSRVLQMLKDPFGDGREELRSVAELMKQEDRYTNWHDAEKNGRIDTCGCGVPRDACRAACGGRACACERSKIDHLLLSKGLWGRVVGAGAAHGHDATRVSDHYPLYVELDVA